MEVLRVHLKAWTASYRFPPFAVMQPSLRVPPLSTIYGLISAAAGRIVTPGETDVGFVAPSPSQLRATDLEKIYQVGEGGGVEKTNVIERDFIYAPELYLYLTNLELEPHFHAPRYPLLLGRSSDLARVVEIKLVKLEPTDEAEFQFTILPFPWEGVASPILALPIAFNEEVPRRPLAVRPFHILEGKPQRVRVNSKHGQIFRDLDKGWGVYLHALR